MRPFGNRGFGAVDVPVAVPIASTQSPIGFFQVSLHVGVLDLRQTELRNQRLVWFCSKWQHGAFTLGTDILAAIHTVLKSVIDSSGRLYSVDGGGPVERQPDVP